MAATIPSGPPGYRRLGFSTDRPVVLIFVVHRSLIDAPPGLVAQRESIRLTRGGSLVRSQPGPLEVVAAHTFTVLRRPAVTESRSRHGAHRPPVLMMVHAHPDDESSQTGGTLARYAAAGCRTVLVTCTDGAQGDADGGAKPGEPGHDPRQVAAHRARELDAAAHALGVHDVVKLGYPDSGPTGHGAVAPESFSQRPVTPMISRLVRLMRIHQPDVVITYPANGMSGHPDHIRTHDVVVAAHANIIANRRANAAGEGADSPTDGPRLYYIALSVSRLRAAQASVRAAFGDDAWAPPDELGVDDDEITTVVDVAQFWDTKLRALAAHASQPDAAMLLQMFSGGADPVEAGSRVEEYVRAYPTATAADFETDFFGS